MANAPRRLAILAAVAVLGGVSPTALAQPAPATRTARTVAGALGSGPVASFSRSGGPLAWASGRLLDGDGVWNVVRSIDPRRRTATIAAGNGSPALSGLPAPRAVAVGIGSPTALVADGSGGYLLGTAVTGGARVLRVDRLGRLTLLAGGGDLPPSAAGGPAQLLRLGSTDALTRDPRGGFWVADAADHRVLHVDAAGRAAVALGTGTAGPAVPGLPAPASPVDQPGALAVAADGALLVADSAQDQVLRIDPVTRLVSVVLRGPGPRALAAAPGGGLLVGDDQRLQLVRDGRSRTLRQEATAAVTTGPDGTVYASTPDGLLALPAHGPPVRLSAAPPGPIGDGGPATRAQVLYPVDVALSGGSLLVVDAGPATLRAVDRAGTIRRLLDDEPGPCCDPLAASVSGGHLLAPVSVASDGGDTYLLDALDGRLQRRAADGHRTRVVGVGGGPCLSPRSDADRRDGGRAVYAQLCRPQGITARGGTIVVADTGDQRVRVIRGGTISTLAGTGSVGYSGDGGPARAAQLTEPSGVALDRRGRVFVADTGNHVIRRVDPDGIIRTVAGTGTCGALHDGPATTVELCQPVDLAADDRGNLLVLDSGHDAVLQLRPDGRLRLVAGGREGFAGDGGDARRAAFTGPRGLTVSPDGHTAWIADTLNHRVRRASLP